MFKARSIDRAALILVVCAIFFDLASSPADAAPPNAPPETYTVRSGDTLYAIALKYHTTVAALKELNGLGSSDIILVGQSLLVPTADSTSGLPSSNSTHYIVQAGDTLFRIALRYGVTMRELARFNDIHNPNMISIGDAVSIPSIQAAKSGIVVDPVRARQGGTLLIQVSRPELANVGGTFNNRAIRFTRAAGNFYALVGVSRCAKVGSIALKVEETDLSGRIAAENMAINVAATAFPVEKITLAPSKLAILSDQALIKREAEQLAIVVNRFSTARLWNGVFRQPVYNYVTENFGTRRSYNGGPVGACGHEGTDFRGAVGDPVYSDARGRVVFAALTEVRGNMVVVDHGLGVYSGFYHMSELAVRADQMVESGELIGKVGSTGLSTGPHLHWSIWVAGEYVDPMDWTKKEYP